jgi:glycosyltransferase involved in cell wall biosynthesis
MKVLYIINEMHPAGAELLLTEALPFFQAKLESADVLVLKKHDSYLQQKIQKTVTGKFFILGTSMVYNPLLVFKLIPVIKKYDLIHVHLFPALYWVSLAKFFSKSAVKLVYTEHSTHNKRRDNFLFSLTERFIYSIYSKIVCVTVKAEINLRNHLQCNTGKITTINNGINLSSFINAEPSNDLQNGDIKIIMVARFRKPKDQKTPIKSLLYLNKNVHLYLVGQGELLEDCNALSEKLQLNDRVHFLGLRNDVPSLLKAADIVVLSSQWEGLSLSSIEGMACGKPFIASDVEGLREVVSGAGLLFKYGDEKDLASKIQILADDKNHYTQIAESCKSRAMQYDIKVMVDKYIDLYDE